MELFLGAILEGFEFSTEKRKLVNGRYFGGFQS